MLRNVLIISVLQLCCDILPAQDDNVPTDTVPTKIEILHANTLEYDDFVGANAKRLLGEVMFRHEAAYMFCDSAWYFDLSNSFKAFGNVSIKQGDTILLVGNYLEYDGNMRMAKMRDSVILRHNKSYLITDSLDYDRNLDVAYYFDGGRIFDGTNKLKSRRGYYHTHDKNYYAVDTVVLHNPQYDILCDTMRYNTDSAVAFFYGPTDIVADSNVIYCENGYYNTLTDIARFSRNAWLRSGSNYLRGDSLYYDRKLRYGEAFRNVSVIDTAENVNAYGHYGFYYERPQNAMLTDSTLVLYLSKSEQAENDTAPPNVDTVFMHCDTVFITADTADFKLIRAFRQVQVFKSDMQARCDSLTVYSGDSIVHMFYQPMLWSQNAQASAEHIELYIKDKNPYTFYLKNNAFGIQTPDSVHFNQLKSKDITGQIRDNKITEIEAVNSCESLYYIEDEDSGDLQALNHLLCAKMMIYFVDSKLSKIWCYDKPDGTITPIGMVQLSQTKLRDFNWADSLRPKTKDDIFVWKTMSLATDNPDAAKVVDTVDENVSGDNASE